jgi:cell division protein FtsQ
MSAKVKPPQRSHAKAQSRAARRGTLRSRILGRVSALAFLAGTLTLGLYQGGHLDYEGSPWHRLPGKAASLVGFAADDVRISGLVHQAPEQILAAIGVTPGGSLIGFDAGHARRLLENLDWVSSARVTRAFPNQLEIAVVERQPFAIWQRAGSHYVIDRTGIAMSTLDPKRMGKLLLVTGEGAQGAAQELVNRLEAHPHLRSRVKAAARVGQRRWTLYLDSGATVALPEHGEDEAMGRIEALDRAERVLSKGITGVDLRAADRIVIGLAAVPEPKKGKMRVSAKR